MPPISPRWHINKWSTIGLHRWHVSDNMEQNTNRWTITIKIPMKLRRKCKLRPNQCKSMCTSYIFDIYIYIFKSYVLDQNYDVKG